MNKNNIYKKIPKVDMLLNNFGSNYNKKVLKYCINKTLKKYRTNIGKNTLKDIDINDILQDIKKEYDSVLSIGLKPIVNATGVILHTNLGRAPLCEKDYVDTKEIACGYSNLEYNFLLGERGDRYIYIEEYLNILTGAESALIVNNNAAAVFLILNTFSNKKYVLVSRSELVEIGGNFRIPEVIKSSGAIIKEVGTTNKTKITDYIEAIDEETSMLLKVHKSNYYIGGFFEEVSPSDIANIAKKYKLISYYDIGSGVLNKTLSKKLNEPFILDTIKYGFDLVSFSGDKLLGGPQAGIIIGKKYLIDTLKKNQLLRILRVDKITLTLLQATLKHYLCDNLSTLPVISMLMQDEHFLNKKAEKLKKTIAENFLNKLSICKVEKAFTYAGGGSSPKSELVTYVVFIKFRHKKSFDIKNKLLTYRIPIVCRLNEEGLVFDILTIEEKSFNIIIEALKWAITI